MPGIIPGIAIPGGMTRIPRPPGVTTAGPLEYVAAGAALPLAAAAGASLSLFTVVAFESTAAFTSPPRAGCNPATTAEANKHTPKMRKKDATTASPTQSLSDHRPPRARP